MFDNALEKQDKERDLYLKSYLTKPEEKVKLKPKERYVTSSGDEFLISDYVTSDDRKIRIGPREGKPDRDKPWLSEYTNEQILESIPHRRMYNDLEEACIKYGNNIAIDYLGNKITYSELLRNVQNASHAFKYAGVEKGDIVTILMPAVPETVYAIYALNRIGAVASVIDPRINANLICDYINASQSKMAIVIDKNKKSREKFEYVANNTSLQKVISVSPLLSSNKKLLRKATDLINAKNISFTKWEDFIIGRREIDDAEPFTEGETAAIVYTSGTSGNPKGVELSNEAFNALAVFKAQSLETEIGDKFLLIMPPFLAYGLGIGIHTMLCSGQHLVMIPNFSLDKADKMLGKLLKKHRPQCVMGVPNFLSILIKYKKDLSYLKGVIVGGDHLDKEIEKNARDFFKSLGLNCYIKKGWGMTETASCASVTKSNSSNELGSVGIPLSGNNIKLLQAKSGDEDYDIDAAGLGYNEEGVLFLNTPTVMNGYYKNDDATKRIMYKDKEGRTWINTGDIFEVDEAGNMFFHKRVKNIVVRPDGHNIPSTQIESIASSMKEVSESIVIGIPSKKYDSGRIAVLCITLEKSYEISYEDLLKSIAEECEKNLQPRDRAKVYVVLDEMMYTPNGKINYLGLSKYVEELVADKKINEVDDNAKPMFLIDAINVNSKKRVKIRK